MDEPAITLLLRAASAGDAIAMQDLFRTVYSELHRLAHSQRKRWSGNETLNTTALIHEVFLKLADGRAMAYENRAHFFATAAKAMRHVLINYAEQQNAGKRGGNAERVPMDQAELFAERTLDELLNIEAVLSRLERDSPRQCRIVECRVFGGMSIEETATALGISPATVKRDWQIASTTLYSELRQMMGGSALSD
jgi:RNA polymerase sigma factor (TIGR02999 family)